MNTFRILTINDKKQMNTILKQAPWTLDYVSSEYVFENLFAWNYTESIEIMWCGHKAILRSLLKGKKVYLPPVASTEEDFDLCMDKIHKMDPNAKIVGLTEEMLPMMKRYSQFILYDDVLSEYIYLSTDMIELKGGKYHRKRNLLSQFSKKYQYTLKDYTPQDLPHIIDLLIRYEKQGGTTDDKDAILHTLDNIQKLDFTCDLLFVHDVLVAFSIGTISIFNHGVLLFEKADVSYTGSYAAIIQLVYEKRYGNVTYTTRQEDLGLPELRKAKLSYYPAKKEKKYACIFDDELKEFHQLYMQNFNDSKPYVDFFFLHQVEKDNTIGIKLDGKLVSGLHLIHKLMYFNNQSWDVSFIVAAATNLEYRRTGLMKKVMIETFMRAYEKNEAFLSLYPVSQDYYKPYGFITYTFTEEIGLDRTPKDCLLEQTVNSDLLSLIYEQSVKSMEGFMVRNKSFWLYYMNSLYQDQYEFSLIKHESEVIGYIAHKEQEIDEFCLIQDVLPIVDGYDFTRYMIPATKHLIPQNMIRIINLKSLLSKLRIDIEHSFEVKIKFTDDIVLENNIVLKLDIQNGAIKFQEWMDYQIEISLEEFTSLLFLGEGDPRLSFFIPKKQMVNYDKF